MRIIAGTYRGRRLIAARDLSIRPTADRAKQTIFDILATRVDLDGARVLDLFAGSGSLGLEAISRGAAAVTFVEKARSSLEILGKNIASLGCGDRSEVVQADVFWYLKNSPRAFDLVFIDPPYALENIAELPARLHESRAVGDGTWVVMEHSRASAVPLDPAQYDVIQKPFGQTVALILHAHKDAAPAERNDP
jgi:16S rRNA (guanine966-N2)-methyltransferase